MLRPRMRRVRWEQIIKDEQGLDYRIHLQPFDQSLAAEFGRQFIDAPNAGTMHVIDPRQHLEHSFLRGPFLGLLEMLHQLRDPRGVFEQSEALDGIVPESGGLLLPGREVC